MAKTLYLLGTLWLTLWISVAVSADERDIDRSAFAVPGQPAWTALTAFEMQVIDRFTGASAQQASADELLALFLVASGNVRSEADYHHYREQLLSFLASHDELIEADSPRETGALLLRLMHRHFLGAGYDANQSAMAEILDTGVYNCISSALLYIVLAEYLGLNPSGVIMPSHAFAQLMLDDGQIIEVETTSEDGFDVIRDPEFFARQAEQWFSERRLVVADYSDYKSRRQISAAELGFENMWVQHISVDRMNYADRLRMAELKGLMQADDLVAQHNRLVYYYQEADYLKRHDEAAWTALMSRIDPYLSDWQTVSLFEQHRFTDRDTLLPMLLLQSHHAEWMLSNNKVEEGLGLAEALLAETPDQLRDAHVIRAGALQAIEQYYMSLAARHWENQQWGQVISVYHEYLGKDLESPSRSVFQVNLEAAYLNSSSDYWQSEERDVAISLLEACIIRLPVAEQCHQRLQEMRQVLL